MVCFSEYLFDGDLGRRVGLLGPVLVASCLVVGGVWRGMVADARRLQGRSGRLCHWSLGVLLEAIGAHGATVGPFDVDVWRGGGCGDSTFAARRCAG